MIRHDVSVFYIKAYLCGTLRGFCVPCLKATESLQGTPIVSTCEVPDHWAPREDYSPNTTIIVIGGMCPVEGFIYVASVGTSISAQYRVGYLGYIH